MPHRPLLALLCVISLALGASCFNEAKAPSVVPTRALGPVKEAPAARPSGPVRVIFREPGDERAVPWSAVAVMFDRPMRRMTAPTAKITDSSGGSLAGEWRWVGTSAALFSPRSAYDRPELPYATELTVTIPAGLEAEDGSSLGAPFSYRFATERPAVVSVEPREGQVVADGDFEVLFNQPVSPEEVSRTAQLLVPRDPGSRDAKPAVVRLRARPVFESVTRVALSANEPLPPGVPVVLTFDASLHGTEGPLPSGKSERFERRTLGPLVVLSAGVTSGRAPSDPAVRPASGRCATSSLAIELSNPVTVRELKAHTRLVPSAAIDWNHGDDDVLTKVEFSAHLLPGRTYELVVTAGMKDSTSTVSRPFGQALARPFRRALDLGHAPWLHIGDEEVFEAEGPRGGPHAVTVESANLAAYDLLVEPLTEVALARYLADAGPTSLDPLAEARRHFPRARVDAIHPAAPSGALESHAVSLDALLRGRGAALVVAETPGPTAVGPQLGVARLVTETDLGISARMGLRGGVVWVTHLSDGKPAGGAIVAVRDATGGEVATARADESGMALLPAAAYSPVGELGALDPHAILVARAGDDWTFRRISDALEQGCKDPELGRESLTGLVFTDRREYALGGTIEVKALFKDERGDAGAPLTGRAVHLAVTGAQGNLVSAVDGKLDSYGGFTSSVRVPGAERPGPWALRADVLSAGEPTSGTASTTVRVVTPDPADAERAAAPLERDRLAVPEPPVTMGAPRAAESRGTLALAADRATYEVGQTATVLLRSPFKEADALVTVEGAQGPRGERLRADGPTPALRVPITADMAPSAHVSVVLLDRTPGGQGASFGVGDVDLRVDASARRLGVGIVPVARPGSSDFVDADVTVTDPAGAPVRASVTFFAVDDRGPRVPDLDQAFETLPVPSSYWLESRSGMRRALPPGGPGGIPPGIGDASSFEVLAPPSEGTAALSSAPHPRGGPGRTVFFDGSLVTDVVGRVHVRFPVPGGAGLIDGSGALRLVAVAAGEGARFGAGEQVVDVSPPLGVEAQAPEVVRAGDTFEVTAVVTSAPLGAGPVSGPGKARTAIVTLSAIGLDVGPEVTKEVELFPGARVVTRWPVRAPEVGKAEIVFRVRAGDLASETRLVRHVVAPVEPESVVLYGEARSASAEGLGHFGPVRADEGGLDLKVASSILVGLDDGLESVLQWPYVDTEQHVTRLVALVGLADLVRDFRVPLGDPEALADREVAAILEGQLGDGSFASWPGAPAIVGEAAWRSTYALWALSLASQHDRAVPSDAMARALGFVRSSLSTWDRTPHERAQAAFALDVLADIGFADIERMNALFQARAHLPLFARALLAHAMTVAQMDNGLVDDLLADAQSHLRSTPDGATVVDEGVAEYDALLDSNTRSTAMVLRALVARAKSRAPNVFKKIRPPELVSRVARGLLSARRGGTWRTPEETIWALRALEDYRAAHVPNHPDVDAFFYLNGAELIKLPLHEREARAAERAPARGEWQASVSFGMRKLLGAHADGGTLGLRVKGGEELHYEVRLRSARPQPPADGVDQGFALDKRIVRLPLDGRTSAPIRKGDHVQVDVVVVTPAPRDHVVLDDPLPGGLTRGALPYAPGLGIPGSEARDRRVEFRADRIVVTFEHLPAGVTHVLYVAEASYPGRFVVPPTRVACLYEPEWLGATGASSLEVSE